MLKITLEIKDKNDETATVTLKTQKDLSKATETEKRTASVVYNAVADTLKNLK